MFLSCVRHLWFYERLGFDIFDAVWPCRLMCWQQFWHWQIDGTVVFWPMRRGISKGCGIGILLHSTIMIICRMKLLAGYTSPFGLSIDSMFFSDCWTIPLISYCLLVCFGCWLTIHWYLLTQVMEESWKTKGCLSWRFILFCFTERTAWLLALFWERFFWGF